MIFIDSELTRLVNLSRYRQSKLVFISYVLRTYSFIFE